jgi:hypothetical protein
MEHRGEHIWDRIKQWCRQQGAGRAEKPKRDADRRLRAVSTNALTSRAGQSHKCGGNGWYWAGMPCDGTPQPVDWNPPLFPSCVQVMRHTTSANRLGAVSESQLRGVGRRSRRSRRQEVMYIKPP